MINKKRVDFLPNISIKKLEGLYHEEKNAKAKIRLQCAILRKEGNTLDEISRVTKKSKSTIGDILTRFDNKGIVAKDAVKQNGQPKRLSDSQLKKLRRAVEKSPMEKKIPFSIWTTKLVQYFIEKNFGVKYVLMQVHRILRKLGMSMQKQRPEHIRANKELQRQFKKNLNEELRNLILADMRSSFWTNAHSSLNPIS
jgi:transposase